MCDPLPYLVKPYIRNLYGLIRLSLALHYPLLFKALLFLSLNPSFI
jgi:hypothetical protein